MTERRLRISGAYPPRLRGQGVLRPMGREVPSLRLVGQWLAAAGFRVGSQVRVEIERGRVVLTAELPGAGERGKPELGEE